MLKPPETLKAVRPPSGCCSTNYLVHNVVHSCGRPAFRGGVLQAGEVAARVFLGVGNRTTAAAAAIGRSPGFDTAATLIGWFDGWHGTVRPDRDPCLLEGQKWEARSEASVPAQQPPPGQEARLSPSHVNPGRTCDSQRSATQGPPTAVGLTDSERSPERDIWTIRDRATFDALRRSGRRIRRGPLTVTWGPVVPGVPPRVAYAIGRKAGGAVVRNRIRRRLRAVFWDSRFNLRPGAYLVSGTDQVATMPYGELRTTLWEILDVLRADEVGPTVTRPDSPVG